MRDSDVRVVDAAIEFDDIALDRPFTLANAAITGFSVAQVAVTVENRAGQRSSGTGVSTLSIPWSWPLGEATWQRKDSALRGVVESLAAQALESGHGDPFEHWDALQHGLSRLADAGESGSVPSLALDLALGAVDNAIHDAWAKSIGRPAPELYDAGHLNSDAGRWLGAEFDGVWPGGCLAPARTRLPVQHVMGVSDPIASADSGAEDRSLEEWVQREGFENVKIKLVGEPDADADRVAAIAAVMARQSREHDLALDANEGYESIDEVLTMLDTLRERSPDAAARVIYVEQPVPREREPDAVALAALSDRVPVLMDEGLTDVRQLAGLRDAGWSGLVVKAAKGQSLALLCAAFASRQGMFLALQDLTATGLALEHSARLASVLPVSSRSFEYNSRQYAPGANAELAQRRPELVAVVDGHITVGATQNAGIV